MHQPPLGSAAHRRSPLCPKYPGRGYSPCQGSETEGEPRGEAREPCGLDRPGPPGCSLALPGLAPTVALQSTLGTSAGAAPPPCTPCPLPPCPPCPLPSPPFALPSTGKARAKHDWLLSLTSLRLHPLIYEEAKESSPRVVLEGGGGRARTCPGGAVTPRQRLPVLRACVPKKLPMCWDLSPHTTQPLHLLAPTHGCPGRAQLRAPGKTSGRQEAKPSGPRTQPSPDPWTELGVG